MAEQPALTVTHNREQHRFEVQLDDALARLDYQPEDGRLAFVHTEVPVVFRGKGIAEKLAAAALNYARENHLQVVSRCQFVSSYLRRHREYADLVDDSGA